MKKIRMEKPLGIILFIGIFILILWACILILPEKNSKDTSSSIRPEECPPERMRPFQAPLIQPTAQHAKDQSLVSQTPSVEYQENRATSSPIIPIFEKEEDKGTYIIHRMTYHSVGDPKGEVVTFFYSPKGYKKSPPIVILPITKGDYYTEHFANYFAGYGFFILRFQSRGDLVKVTKKGREALEEFKDHIRFYVIDIIRGIDWLQSQPGVDVQRIGILGISQGAIIGSLVTGLDPRIRSGAFLLGGGGLAGILLTSEEGSIIQIRENILKSSEIPEKSFYQEANNVLSMVDPLTYAGCIKPLNVVLVDALFDRVIRSAYADQLWEKMGRPARIQIPTGHYTSALFLPYVRVKIFNHFEETLGKPNLASN